MRKSAKAPQGTSFNSRGDVDSVRAVLTMTSVGPEKERWRQSLLSLWRWKLANVMAQRRPSVTVINDREKRGIMLIDSVGKEKN